MQLIISPQRGEEYKKQELQVVRFLFFFVRSRNYHFNEGDFLRFSCTGRDFNLPLQPFITNLFTIQI